MSENAGIPPGPARVHRGSKVKGPRAFLGLPGTVDGGCLLLELPAPADKLSARRCTLKLLQVVVSCGPRVVRATMRWMASLMTGSGAAAFQRVASPPQSSAGGTG